MKKDNVNRPDHYRKGNVACIKVRQVMGTNFTYRGTSSSTCGDLIIRMD